MKIIYEKKFQDSLRGIATFIAKDKLSASTNFKRELKEKIEMLYDNPMMYKKSNYFEEDSYRDMTFKGYTIIYRLVSKEELRVLDIFKWVKR